VKSERRWSGLSVALATGVVGVVFALTGSAQVRTKTTTTSGKAAQQVKVDRAEVVLVAGNDLVLKMDDGTIRHIPNVPDSFRATVDGKEVGIYDLKAGMTFERTTTITTTPKVVTTVQTVKGRVWHVKPPSSIYLTMEDGSISMEREQLSQMASRQITYIDHLEKAVIRIENKTYGICRVTGRLIDKARLRAVPHATLSLEAKLGLVKAGE